MPLSTPKTGLERSPGLERLIFDESQPQKSQIARKVREATPGETQELEISARGQRLRLEAEPRISGKSGELALDDGERRSSAAPDQHEAIPIVLLLDGGERSGVGLPELTRRQCRILRRDRFGIRPRRGHLVSEKEVGDLAGELAGIGARRVAEHEDGKLLLWETKRVGAEPHEPAAVGDGGKPPVLAEAEAAGVVLGRAVVETPWSHQPP